MGELYHACYRRLVAQVYAFTTDLIEAQDVVQEAFARAIARPQGLADIDNPEAWLRTVAVNVVRRRWRRRQLLDTILLRDRPVTRLVEAAPGPERTDLRDALAGLPVSYREVIVLHYFADLPVEEVGTVLGVPTGTVKSRLSRGRSALAARLGDYRGAGEATSAPGQPGRPDPPAGDPDPMVARTARGAGSGGAVEEPARVRPAVRRGVRDA
ncbi:sigma-70 family RNA polymerase sigma factor [Plantactinospora sp. B6F1]